MTNQWLAWFVAENERETLSRRLQRTGRYDHVRLVSGWVVANQQLAPWRRRISLQASLGEDRGFLFSYCDCPDWASVDARRLERLLRDPAHLDQLPGDFSFARLLPDGSAQVVRSCGGQGPFHVSRQAERVVVSTRLDWIASTQEAVPELDPLCCALGALSFPTALAPRSVLKGTQSVPAGHCATVSPSAAVDFVRYFRPAPLRLPAPNKNHQRQLGPKLKKLVSEKLSAELAPGENLLLFSGGLDSSLLVELAKNSGIQFHASTLLPVAHDTTRVREEHFANLLSPKFLSQERVVGDESTLEKLVHCPGLVATGFFWGLAARSLRTRPTLTTVASGYLADECFGVFRAADWINATPLSRLIPLLRQQPRDFPLSSWWFQRKWSGRHGLLLPNRLPLAFAPALHQEYAEFYRSEFDRTQREPCCFRLDLTLRYADYSGIYAEVAAAQGLRAVLPYSQRRIVELAYETPPGELFHARLAKYPLRAAAEGLLPNALAQRADMGDWEHYPATASVSASDVDAAGGGLLDKTWLAQQPEVDFQSAGAVTYVRELGKAKERLIHEQDAFFQR